MTELMNESAEHRTEQNLNVTIPLSYEVPSPMPIPATVRLTDREMIEAIYLTVQEFRSVLDKVTPMLDALDPKTVDKVARMASNPLLKNLFGG